MPSCLTALPPALPTELLTYVLTMRTYPTTLLVCQSRASFLSSLTKSILHSSHPASPPPYEPEGEDPDAAPPEQQQRHPLLVPTLHQIATSRNIQLVYVPTVTHLRAWLAVFPGPGTGEEGREEDKLGRRGPLLVVYGVLGLHRDTSEWSAQGLGNSLAGVVEAGVKGGRRIVLVEEKTSEEDEEEEMELGDDGAEGRRKRVVWDERVPMLNGSVRRAGLESEDGGWSGRTVEVGRIVGRWFKFKRGDWDSDED